MSMPRELVKEKLFSFLKEDVGQGDVTSQLLIPQDMLAEADVMAKDDGVVAGLEEAHILVEAMGLTSNLLVSDGATVKAGTALMHIEGNARDLLAVERTLLNIISRMSGIATKTKALQDTAKEANPSIKVVSTRKVAPGCLYFDKRAVTIGGGDSHRLHLDDLILIKDNHKELVGGVREAMRRARAASFTKKIEVEVSSGQEAIEAAESGADILMFDNMSPSSIKAAVQELERRGMRRDLVLEASGGINENNILEFAMSGVDLLSLGSLTHSVKAFDVSLEVRRHEKK